MATKHIVESQNFDKFQFSFVSSSEIKKIFKQLIFRIVLWMIKVGAQIKVELGEDTFDCSSKLWAVRTRNRIHLGC